MPRVQLKWSFKREKYTWDIIGIDLGTSYSRVGVWHNSKAVIVPNEHGMKSTPSCVSITDEGYVVGKEATEQMEIDPASTIVDSKRLIGRDF